MDYGPKTASPYQFVGLGGIRVRREWSKGAAELNVKVSEGKGYLLL